MDGESIVITIPSRALKFSFTRQCVNKCNAFFFPVIDQCL